MTPDEVLAVAQRALRQRWPDVSLCNPQVLEGSDRTMVVRGAVEHAGMTSAVVKLQMPAEDRQSLVREPASLDLLRDRPGCLQLLAVSTDPPGVVVEDLGSGSDVASHLLADDPKAAALAVQEWAVAIGEMHRQTLGTQEQFQALLDAHADRLRRPQVTADPMPAVLAAAADALAAQLPELGIEPSRAALTELRGIDASLGGQVRALTPADACPDNNLQTAEGLVLLDFEGGQYRDVAWDAAYLTVPWPSCWCSWLLPEDVASAALEAWKGRVAHPYLRSAAFAADLRTATLGWAFISTSWFLAGALHAEHSEPLMPPRRAMIAHRMGLTAELHDERFPALSSLAAAIRDAARERWGDLTLELAPAFRGRAATPSTSRRSQSPGRR